MATPDFSQLGGSTDPEKRSFWSRPEGILGLITLAGLAGYALVNINTILEFLIRATSNVLELALLLGVLGVVIFLITSRDIRTAVFFLFKSMMRSLTGTVIQLNPIAIMKIYIDDLKKKRQQMQGQIDTLGQL